MARHLELKQAKMVADAFPAYDKCNGLFQTTIILFSISYSFV